MSAADALIRATTSVLSASFSMTGPLAALMYSVLPSTLSRVPATRCVVGCCADAVETANTAAKATAVIIRIVLMSVLPMGVTRGRAYTDRPEWRSRRRGRATLRAISGERILMGRLVTGPQHYRRRFLSPVVARLGNAGRRPRSPLIEVNPTCRRGVTS